MPVTRWERRNVWACLVLLVVRSVFALGFGQESAAFQYADTRQSLRSRQRWNGGQTCPLYATVSSWDALEEQLGDCVHEPKPLSIDSVLDPSTPSFSSDRPTLFRERHGWCPYSERVWLTLELQNTNYDTVRIDNTGGGRPSYFGGYTPQIKWHDTGRTQGESLDLVEELDERYNLGLQSSDTAVQHAVTQFRNIFPKARPSSRAAFLFQYNREPLWKSTFEATLEQTDKFLSTTEGAFLAGPQLTAADVAWAPFLERYRYQLPCFFEGLEPDDADKYPHLAQWYKAMDDIPAYACRVKGDASSWRKVLTMAGFGNSGVPPAIQVNMENRLAQEVQDAKDCTKRQDLWKEYATERPYVASTPQAQAALTIVRSRNAIVVDALKQSTKDPWNDDKNFPRTEEEIESGLQQLVETLLSWDKNHDELSVSSHAGDMASLLDSRMCVPRDMGAMPAAYIKLVAWESNRK